MFGVSQSTSCFILFERRLLTSVRVVVLFLSAPFEMNSSTECHILVVFVEGRNSQFGTDDVRFYSPPLTLVSNMHRACRICERPTKEETVLKLPRIGYCCSVAV